MNQDSTGGIIAFSIIVVLVLLGIDKAGGLEGAKQDILAFFEILK